MTEHDELLDLRKRADELLLSFISASGLQLIGDQAKLVEFDEGELICPKGMIPDHIHFLVNGSVRSLCTEGNNVSCLEQLKPGSWIGLPSFLTGQACEECIASTTVTTLAIPDELIIQLLNNDPQFSVYTSSTVFLPELFSVLQKAVANVPIQRSILCQMSQGLKPMVHLFHPSDTHFLEKGSDLAVYVSSNNLRNFPIGSIVTSSDQPLISASILPLRLIEIPASAIHADSLLHNTPNLETDPSAARQDHDESALAKSLAARATKLSIALEREIQPLLPRSEDPIEGFINVFKYLTSLLAVDVTYRKLKQLINDALRSDQPIDVRMCALISRDLGLQSSYNIVAPQHAYRLLTPALIQWKQGFAVLLNASKSSIIFESPVDGRVEIASEQLTEFFAQGISIITFEKTSLTKNQVFGFKWLLPFLLKHQYSFSLILLASFASQLLMIANPLLIQVIIDKVISTHSLDVLPVIAFSIILTGFLSSLLTGLRSFLLAQTSNRIDSVISVVVMDHLLRLPLDYFDKRAVGDLSTRVGELEKIRNFLTGQSLTAIIDLLFVFVYVTIMIFYSVGLTVAALLVVPLQVTIFVIGSSIYRTQLNAAAQLHGENQAQFVELLGGIQTVKTQNIENVSRWKWQAIFSKYLDRSLNKSAIAIFVNESSNFLQNLSQLLIIACGAVLVVQGGLSLGALIAFRIIAGYATQPMLRITSILQSFQEIKVAINRLADVIDTPEEETDNSAFTLPRILGNVQFKDVSFQFPGSPTNVLKNISFTIEEGTFLAIVGQSGSGKSTLTKLLSRLYTAQKGSIFIDQYDISKVTLNSLRQQLGVVPQDPLLFRGSIRDNIAIANSNATMEQIVKAAKLACAHQFIEELPYGYNTNVGERGSSLSGGQRQRITLARTLLNQPRLLILDEATSALDYQTELQVCQNLLTDLGNATVFYVTHRLASIRDADLIMVMHEGIVDELGSHVDLMKLRGRYFSLYTQQAEGDIS